MVISKISIVTPCRNASRYIAETVRSVLDQVAADNVSFEIEYVVVDGQSTDGTLQILERLAADDSRLRVISEPDKGMYDALAKGLNVVTGDIVGYLNAGDLYHPRAFQIIATCFNDPGVDWLTGLNVVYNDYSQVVSVSLPFCYRKRLIDCGSYGGILPCIQQESTFWRRRLHTTVDLKILSECRLAGDHYLWRCFSTVADLRPIQAFLGGFRRHPGQLSENYSAYRKEQLDLSIKPTLFDAALAGMYKFGWYLPARIKRELNRTIIWYEHDSARWVI